MPGCAGEMLNIIEFDLPKTYKFQKEKTKAIEVVLVKVTKSQEEETKSNI